MPGRTAIAAVSGVAAGMTLTVAAVDGITTDSLSGLLLLTAVRFFPTVVVTIVALAALRRWINAHEERNRREIEAMAEYRRQMASEFERRSRELADHEERLNRHSALNQEQYRILVDQLRDARRERDAMAGERDRLQEDFDVLAAEYNGMVLGEVDERSAQFSKARQRGTRPGAGRERGRERGATDPPMSYIGRQPHAEPEQHARPAEG